MNKRLTRFLAVLSAVCITAGSFVYRAETQPQYTISAKTLAEIEQEKKEKQ